MRFRELNILKEMPTVVTQDELEGMKTVIASKIKQLPDDDATAKALKEIEELLQHVNAGGRMGMIYDQLEQISDPSVLAAQKMLARYILSIESTPEQRKEFFSLWKKDELVNIPLLLSKKQHSFEQIFTNYSSNNLIKEFVDDVMSIDALGHGRGEFGLNVLSKRIYKPADNKGDLRMKVGGRDLQIEVKTTSVGAARFSDQQVRPAEGYEQAAIKLNDFVRRSKSYPIKVPGYGLNIDSAIDFAQNCKPAERSEFLTLAEKCIHLIFGGSKANKHDVKAIVDAIKSGDAGGAKQAWSQASFNYYMSFKEDDGVLAINLNEKSFMFYSDAKDLEKQGLRFHSSTAYLSTVKDPARGVYPQMEVVPTTYGGKEAMRRMPKYNKKQEEQAFLRSINEWSKSFALRRGVKDLRTISGIAKSTLNMLYNGMQSPEIMVALEKQFPKLQPPTAVKYTTAPKPVVRQPAAATAQPAQPAAPATPAQPIR